MSDEQEPTQEDFAGYPNLDELKRGYRESGSEAKRQKDRAERAESAFQALQMQVPQRQAVPFRKPWEEELATSGVPVDAIRAAIDDRAQELVQRQFEPLTRALSARQTMVGKYKDYNKFESDMMGYVNSDPELQQTYTRIFQADPVAAFDYAYLKFGADQRGKRKASNGAVDEDLVETSIPTNRSGDARRIPRGNEGRVEEAAKAYRDNPSPRTARDYASARLKTAISDDFLNQ